MSGELREERKVVTAVFADLVGSTALAERLDPEEVKLIVGEAVARMVRAIEDFGGTVKDLAGDGVLALFGAPAAHEDDEERAVRASLRIVEEIDEHGDDVARGWGIEGFSVRVGVSTGPVVLGALGAGERVEYAAFGDTVNTAARLQSAAGPGTVLVAANTHRQIELLFAWSEPGELELKGKEAAVVAHTVTGAHPAPVRPGLLTDEARFVGRRQELGMGRAAVERALQGAGGMLFVTGEPGIGKSRLLGETRRIFEESPCEGGRQLWVEGRCASYGESIPYWPFRDLLRNWLGVASDEGELRVRVALRRRVEQLFPDRALELYPYLGSMLGLALEPDAAARLAELSPEALQYRTFEVVWMLLERLADDGPVVAALEDLHWADPTSVQLVERLLPLAEQAAVLLFATGRSERDHSFWSVKELAAREFPHRTTELPLEPLSGQEDRELLAALVGKATLPGELEERILAAAEGNPFFVEELVSALSDAGALVREGNAWRFDHDVVVEVPPTVERVILARIDRLPSQSRDLLVSASVLGRQFSLPLLEAVSGNANGLRDHLHELQRLDLVREARRWPQPEYQFKNALIQEAAYRTVLAPRRKELHSKAAEWLEAQHADNEEEVFGLLAHHWLAAEDEEKAIAYLARAGDKARQEYALDEAIQHYRALLPLLEERGERQEIALVLFKLALALHTSLRFAEANDVYQRAFEHWAQPEPAEAATATLRLASSFLPNDPDPRTAIAWPNIQLCMQLFDRLVEAWPERTIVPSLAERWEISDDGLRYVFHLREGLVWSDGEPLTAHDVEFGIKRVLDPDAPGSSVAIYFVLENGQDYYLRHNTDGDRIGVRALDDRTVEFRLVAPAPYFMSVMNRPDAGPQPRHAIERHGDSWTEPGRQVVSGPFEQAERSDDRLLLRRQARYAGTRPGNVGGIAVTRFDVGDALRLYEQDEIDVVAARYTPRLADMMPASTPEVELGLAGWTGYLSFDHSHPVTSSADFRRALAHSIDRSALAEAAPPNLVVATGGLVPPALQGHTPDIAPRFEPDTAREYLSRSGVSGEIGLAALAQWEPIIAAVAAMWRETLGLQIDLRWWTNEEAVHLRTPWHLAPIALGGWLPGYPDPEYYLRLELHSDSRTNEGGFAYPPFDELIERARQERSDRHRLELFHDADRMAIADRVALIPLVYGRSMAFVKPRVKGWWEFGKTSSSFADLVVDESAPRPPA
ncbi:MAG: AAA family ATPase [Actinobacteria bacterium]|nr:AAA family ATPase [Actinomycetota bacterium]